MKICFIGDIMLSENQLKNGYKDKKSDPNNWFDNVKEYINNNDIIIGNFETTINPHEKLSGYPTFNSPTKFLTDLTNNIKFDVLSVCNNHCCDTNESGLLNTIKEIEKRKVKYLGVYKNIKDYNSKYPLIINKDGLKIGLLNYCESINNDIELKNIKINKISDNIQNDILKIRNKCDYIFCFLHCGKEYSNEPSNELKQILRCLITMGVDHVVCSHTHVPQLVENYNYDGKNHFIIYSLGNFISDQRRMFVDNGKIAIFDIDKYSVNLDTKSIWVSCPDFNELNSYKIMFVDENLNKPTYNLSNKEIFKMNTLK